MGTLRLATRGSPLALRQTELVTDLLRRAHPDLVVEPLVVRTQGDRDASTPLDAIGGQGVFVTEVEAAVADGRADAAVHSAKDMPSVMPEGFVLGAVPTRADPHPNPSFAVSLAAGNPFAGAAVATCAIPTRFEPGSCTLSPTSVGWFAAHAGGPSSAST